MSAASEKIHFVTGRLASPILRDVVAALADDLQFTFSIDELPISVAALMTPDWIAKHIQVPRGTTRVVIPGYCHGDLTPITDIAQCPVERGPKDVRRLHEYFSQPHKEVALDQFQIEIIAEINHADRIEIDDLIRQAQRFAAEGADVIDLGCSPGNSWRGVGDAVRRLVDRGLRVSIDSFDPVEVSAATNAGAELVLSVNGSNRQHAVDWESEVVVIPDQPGDIDSLLATVDWLMERRVRCRMDPVIDPIGVGFAGSLLRYWRCREARPAVPMMMGVGNITELSEVDSAGVNLLLAAVCQEWSIHSVLTTEVIHWSRSSVRELDLARRLVAYAIAHNVPPKHLNSGLVMLRGGEPLTFSSEEIAALSRQIKDLNYRIFAAENQVHLLGGGQAFSGVDPFAIFDQMMEAQGESMTPDHAFYLGYEMCKAAIARQLGKEYRQDEALDWGMLTQAEPVRHRLEKRAKRKRKK